MKIAIDCVGTLLSEEYRARLVALISVAVSDGHNITVWSSDQEYVDQAKRLLTEYDIFEGVNFCTKYSTKAAHLTGLDVFDIAIDDQPPIIEGFLAANKVIHPKDTDEIEI